MIVFPGTFFKISSSSQQLLPPNLSKKLFCFYQRYFSFSSCRSHASFLGCICGIMWTRSFLQTSENYEYSSWGDTNCVAADHGTQISLLSTEHSWHSNLFHPHGGDIPRSRILPPISPADCRRPELGHHLFH